MSDRTGKQRGFFDLATDLLAWVARVARVSVETVRIVQALKDGPR